MRLAVVGGGIAGLAAAHRAVELARERGLPLELALFEAGDRLGGTIQTDRYEGFLVECGPDSFLSEKPWALALCRRLGIEDRLVRTDDRFRRTYVAFRGRLHPLPDGFQLLAPTRLGPDVCDVLRGAKGQGIEDAVIVPIGFVCDHVEVLYDLDVEARAVAAESGLRLHRAETANDHPSFIAMLADLVKRQSR